MREIGIVFVATAAVVGLVGCNPHPVEVEDRADASTPTVESVENRDRVIVPWAHDVSSELLEDAVISQRKIVFRGEQVADRAKEFRRLDILASSDPDQPFLRRVTDVREQGDDHVVVETKPASVTDALYKGSFSTASSSGDGNRTSQQALQNFSLFPDGASISYDGLGTGGSTVGGEATPEGYVDTDFHLSFEIDGGLLNGNKRPDGWVYRGVRSCSSNSDCHEGEHCQDGKCAYHATGNDWSATFDGTPWDDEQHTCEEMTTILEVMRQQEECRRTWRQYWDDEARGDDSESTCAYYEDEPRASRPVKQGDIPPPALAQVEWAKRECRGRIKAFEFDVGFEAKASLKNVAIEGEGGGWTDVLGNSDQDGDGDVDDDFSIPWETGPKLSFVGWLPVIYNLTFELGLDHWIGIDGDGRVTLRDPIGTKSPIEVNAGVHYYADAEAKQEGRFSDHDGEPGSWHEHGGVQPPEFHSIDAQAEGDLGVGVTLTPEMEFGLLLYETAGPFLRFRAPKMKAEVNGGIRTGDRGASGGKCTLGVQAGVQAQVGIATRNVLCSGDGCAGPSFNQSIWDSCSDTSYCASAGRLCVNRCLSNDCSSPAREICSDGKDNDNDGDVDCEDSDCPVVSNERSCDGEDNDCDGEIDEGLDKQTCYRDGDLDGYGGGKAGEYCGSCPGGTVANGDDCDDSASSIHPGATETCNNTDDDCDGTVDEGTSKTTCYRDSDGDRYGARKKGEYCRSCSRVANAAARDSDCDDSDPNIHPGATEKCNAVDDDCDGNKKTNCLVSCNYMGKTTGVCGNAQKQQGSSTCPEPPDYESPEDTCGDGKDNDCDGTVDEASSRNTCYEDTDGDGYGSDSSRTFCQKCSNVSGYVGNDDDCDDDDASVYPNQKCDSTGCVEYCDTDGNCNCI